MLADMRVWVLLNVENVGELMVAEMALKEGDKLMGLARVSTEVVSLKVVIVEGNGHWGEVVREN